MASLFFILRQFDDVNIYLSSIRPYIFNDAVSADAARPAATGRSRWGRSSARSPPKTAAATQPSYRPFAPSPNRPQNFNWNYGIALAAQHDYENAEKTLLQITDETMTTDYVYIAW